MIHTYRKLGKGEYEVGIWEPTMDDANPYGVARPGEGRTGHKAALLTSFLNGGHAYYPHDD